MTKNVRAVGQEVGGKLSLMGVYNGVMYVINGKWTFALDVETGRQIWRTPVKLEPGITREAITREIGRAHV